MESLSITKVEIDNCELVDSRVINVFKNEFTIQAENLGLKFQFIEDGKDSYSIIEKVNNSDFILYHIKLFNFDTGKIQGFLKPIEVGEDEYSFYHISLACLLSDSKEFKIVSFNLFRELKK